MTIPKNIEIYIFSGAVLAIDMVYQLEEGWLLCVLRPSTVLSNKVTCFRHILLIFASSG